VTKSDLLLTIVAFLLLAPRFLFAEDWPTYRHDRLRSAVTSETLEPPLKNVWYFRSRLAYAAPSNLPARSHQANKFGSSRYELLPDHVRYALTVTSAGDSVFFTSHDGRVACLDAATGKPRWEFVTGGAIECSANFVDGLIYVGSDDGYVYCLDAKTGTLAWKHKPVTADKWLISFGRMSSIWPVRTDVLVDGGVAYFGSGIFPHEGMFINSLDVKARQRIWRTACYGYGLAGHVFLSESTVILPTELKGFHNHQLQFDRATGGVHRGEWDSEVRASEDFLFRGGGGTVVDGVRYMTDYSNTIAARNVEGEHTDKRKVLWYTRVSGMLLDPRQTAYAGGVFYAIGNRYGQHPDRPLEGRGGGVYAVNPQDGKVLWSVQIPERTHHLAIANGRLFVSTRQGSIYCFAPKGAPAHGVVDEPVVADPFAPVKTRGGIVHGMLRPAREGGAGITSRGFVLVCDCTEGVLPFELARQTDLYVCAVFDDAAMAQQARERYAKANMHCSRISVWHRKKGTKLPYPRNFADLIVSERAALRGELPKYTAELDSLLKPARGIALMGGREHVMRDGTEVMRDGKPVKVPLEEWAKSQKVPAGGASSAKPESNPKPGAKPELGWEVSEPAHGFRWARRTRPAVNGGGWRQQHGTEGNTMNSHDSALKPPLGIVWYGRPHVTEDPSLKPPLIVDGVMVCPTHTDRLEAYDEYNGRHLWTIQSKNLGRQFNVMVAGGDGIFVPDITPYHGDPDRGCRKIDLWTGNLVRTYPPPFPKMRRGQIAVSADGKTMWRTGGWHDDKERWHCIFATDVATGETLWRVGGPEEGKHDYGWSAIADGRIYHVRDGASEEQIAQLVAEMKQYLAANDPERLDTYEQSQRKFRLLTARDAMTGKVLYEHAVDVAWCDQWVAAHNDKVVLTRSNGAKWWGSWGDPNGHEFRHNQIAVHDGATGKLLWKRICNYRFQPVVTDDTIFAEPWAYDLQTGAKRSRPHPVTGTPGDYAWVRYGKQCGGYNGSSHFLFGRSKGFGYFDTLRDNGFYVSWHHRQACDPDTASGGGMMIKPPMNVGCGCPWSLPYTIAMTTMPDEPAIPYQFFQRGANVPVKHLRINFGASGERRDKTGSVWFTPMREQHPSGLQLTLTPVITFYGSGVNSHGGVHRFSRRSASDVPAENTPDPFLFDAYALGLQRCAVPVTTPSDGKGNFTVRLGFSALPADKPGQRVFDVRLNGKTVLADFDIVKAAGKPHRAVWKEFPVTLEGSLVLDLVAKTREPAPENMPVISAMEILRQQITTFGLKAPQNVWVNERKPETTVEVHVANHRNVPFAGTLAVAAPGELEIAVPEGGTRTGPFSLQPGEQKKIEVGIKNTTPRKTGSHTLTLKLLSADGKVLREHALTVDCLGKLERIVRKGNGRWCMTRKTYETWIRRGSPAHYLGRFPASKGAREPGDLGAACSWIKFHVPSEVGKIHRMRVRLRVSPELQAGWRAMFGSATDARPPKGGWGRLRLIDSPTDVNVDSLKYPELPELLPGGYALEPTRQDPDVVEARLPTDVPRDEHGQGRVQLVLEPTALNGPVYCGPAGHNTKPEDAPQLVIDYEPAPPVAEE